MKFTANPRHLKILILIAGALGLALRAALYITGIDGRGLLTAGHWAHTGIWTVTGFAAIALLVLCRGISGPDSYGDCFPVSAPAALGASLGGCAILVTTIRSFSLYSRMDLMSGILGIGAGLSLLVLAAYRLTGKKPSALFHGLVCLFFAFRMIQQYRFWSANPQMQDYCFYLCAYVALMLCAYHHAEFEAGMGNHTRLWLFSLAAVYFCFLSLKGTMDVGLLLCCGIWAFTSLTCLTGCVCPPQVAEPVEESDGEG